MTPDPTPPRGWLSRRHLDDIGKRPLHLNLVEVECLIAQAEAALVGREALRRYGEHDDNCHTYSRFVEPKCSCGLDAALAAMDDR